MYTPFPQTYNPYILPNQPYSPLNPGRGKGSIPVGNSSGTVRASIFYFNDYHGCSTKMAEVKTAADSFAKAGNNGQVDTFKLAAGDILKGNNTKNNAMWVEFLNLIGLDFSAIGNHELDNGIKSFNDRLQQANYKYVCSNIEINPQGALARSVRDGKIVSSRVENQNGHLYGFVGLTPSDEKYRKPGKKLNNKDISSHDTQKSLQDLQKEVNKLKQTGVNKIILLSHFDDSDNKLAKTITGVDIIVSGHKHRVYQGLKPGKNLFTSPSGEPVIKVEGGRDGEYVGFLDVVFDSNGVITHAQNKLQKTDGIPEDISVLAMENNYSRSEKPIGILRETIKANGFKENKFASFVADSIRKKSGADIVLIPGGSIYEGLEKGIITKNDVSRAIPFSDNLYITKISEKDIINALQNGTSPSEDDDSETHIVQVSGLRYTITTDRKIKDVYFESPEGKSIPISVENPGDKKKFRAVYGEYLIKGKGGFTCLKRDTSRAQQPGWDEKDATIEAITDKKFVPFITGTGDRINVEK